MYFASSHSSEVKSHISDWIGSLFTFPPFAERRTFCLANPLGSCRASSLITAAIGLQSPFANFMIFPGPSSCCFLGVTGPIIFQHKAPPAPLAGFDRRKVRKPTMSSEKAPNSFSDRSTSHMQLGSHGPFRSAYSSLECHHQPQQQP